MLTIENKFFKAAGSAFRITVVLAAVLWCASAGCKKHETAHYDLPVFPNYPSGLVFEKKKIGSELRMARELSSRQELVFAGTVPYRARISFGVGHESPDHAADAAIAVSITGESRKREYTMRFQETNKWIDETLDLSSYTGERITISFSAPRSFGKNDGKLFITCPQLTRSRAPMQRNVVLISIDTLRADHIGCYGYDRDTTPFLDEFSKKALLFENCIAPAPWTLPSHVSLLTGLYSSSHTVIDDGFGAIPVRSATTIPESVKTLPEILHQHNYETRAITTHLYVSEQFGFDRGFNAFFFKQDASAVEVSRQALQWINVIAEQPFFLFLHYFDCHDPYSPPHPFSSLFDPDYSGDINGDLQWLEKFGYSADISARDLQHLIALYDGEIRYVDDALKTLIQGMSDKNLIENTVIIITSDHGEEFKEHGSLRHGAKLFDEVVKVPLLVYIPGEKGSQRIARQVNLVDIMPTVLELLHIPLEHNIDGSSLFCKESNSKKLERLVFSETSRYDAFKACARTNAYKYIADSGFGGAEEKIFSLADDPGEQKNLNTSRNEAVEPKAKEMRGALLKSLSLCQSMQVCFRYAPSHGVQQQSIKVTITTSGHFTYVDALGGWPHGSIHLNEEKNRILIACKNIRDFQKIGINFMLEPPDATVMFSDIVVNGVPATIVAYTNAGAQDIANKVHSYKTLLDMLAADHPAVLEQRNTFLLFKTMSLIPAATLSGKQSWEKKQLSDENRERLRSLGYVW